MHFTVYYIDVFFLICRLLKYLDEYSDSLLNFEVMFYQIDICSTLPVLAPVMAEHGERAKSLDPGSMQSVDSLGIG